MEVPKLQKYEKPCVAPSPELRMFLIFLFSDMLLLIELFPVKQQYSENDQVSGQFQHWKRTDLTGQFHGDRQD